MRYSELSRLLAGVSKKMLTQTLRSLERDGLITRTATPTVPVIVTYELTNLGLSLHQMMRGLKTWAGVEAGEEIEVLRDNRPVAKIIPLSRRGAGSRREIVQELARLGPDTTALAEELGTMLTETTDDLPR